jgi:4-amino-4-deoxy-L-arabinose transferase-like glycosyltransferase
MSFSNFFFGAMDPGGVVAVDKIPGSFWIPAIFVKVFGFSTWAITVPSALAAIAATLVITFVVKKYYGMTAGLIAGSILATTPIVVAVARSNQPQTFYYLAIAVAIRFALVALNEQSRKNLIWAGIWIAVAFHSYMLLSWALWPPLILSYLLTSQTFLKDRLVLDSVILSVSLLFYLLMLVLPTTNLYENLSNEVWFSPESYLFLHLHE